MNDQSKSVPHRWLVAATFLSVAVIVTYARLRHPAFGVLGDFVFHYQFTRAYARSFSEGDWFPRWAGILSGGRGEALFTFYPPLCFLLTTLWQKLFGLDLLNALKVTAFGCFVGAQFSAYSFARLFFTRWSSVLAAVAFVLLPAYPFVALNRGLLPNALALCFVPLALRAAHQLLNAENANETSSWATALFALSVSAIIGTHVITVYLCALGVLILLACSTLRWQGLRNLVTAGLITFALTAFWLVPQLLEISWVNVKLLADQHHYSSYFLFAPPASDSNFHRSWAKLNEAASYFIVLQTVLGSLLAWAVWRKAQTDAQQRLQRYCLALIAFGFFMALSLSAFFWKLLPGLSYLQFPWRWQPLTALATGLLLAAFWENVSQRKAFALWLTLLLLGNGFFTYFVARHPHLPLDHATVLRQFERGDLPPASTEQLREWQTQERYDYLAYFGNQPSYRPRGTEQMLYPTAQNYGGLDFVQGRGEILAQELRNQSRLFRLRSLEPVRVRLNTYAYSHWFARLDGREQTIRVEPNSNLMLLDLPAGEHTLNFSYEVRHPLQRGARWLSAAAWLGFVLWVISLALRAHKEKGA
ncbi:MAG: hypothetical protein HOP19_02030 [Acidobacteria bacterium]|nr:hypothetical protein [Acidobacteriota bacterium]